MKTIKKYISIRTFEWWKCLWKQVLVEGWFQNSTNEIIRMFVHMIFAFKVLQKLFSYLELLNRSAGCLFDRTVVHYLMTSLHTSGTFWKKILPPSILGALITFIVGNVTQMRCINSIFKHLRKKTENSLVIKNIFCWNCLPYLFWYFLFLNEKPNQ